MCVLLYWLHSFVFNTFIAGSISPVERGIIMYIIFDYVMIGYVSAVNKNGYSTSRFVVMR